MTTTTVHLLITQNSFEDNGLGVGQNFYGTFFDAEAAGTTTIKIPKFELKLNERAGQTVYYVLYKETDAGADFRFPLLSQPVPPTASQEILADTVSSTASEIIAHGIFGNSPLLLDFGATEFIFSQNDLLRIACTMTENGIDFPTTLYATVEMIITTE